MCKWNHMVFVFLRHTVASVGQVRKRWNGSFLPQKCLPLLPHPSNPGERMEEARRRALDFSPAEGPPGGGPIGLPQCKFEMCQRDPEVGRGHKTNISSQHNWLCPPGDFLWTPNLGFYFLFKLFVGLELIYKIVFVFGFCFYKNLSPLFN